MEEIRKLHNYRPTPFKAEGYVYKERFADCAVAFVNQLKHFSGQWKGVPFELIDWQEQIIRDLFGIVSRTDETRQFRRAYVELPKKNGKSELAAAIALLLLCCDFEYGAEVYSCATDRQQAGLVFNVAVRMMEQNPFLKKHITYSRSERKMTFKPLGSFYQVVSAEHGNKDGLNSHGIIFDELHAQRNRDFFDVMTTSSGLAREQPLQFIITTAGFDRDSIGWQQHQYADSVLRGDVIDPTFYPVIFAAAEDDDWTDEAVWRKANPSYGITMHPQQFRENFEKAKIDLAEENKFRRLNLNQWVKQHTRWMPMDKWDACNAKLRPDFLEKRVCYGGLDLSVNNDLTALVLVFPPEDDEDSYFFLPFFWIPSDSIEKRVKKDHVPYDKWVKAGLLETTDGAVVDYDFVQVKLMELSKKYVIKDIAFDKWGAQLLSQHLDKVGLTVSEFYQGFSRFSVPMKMLLSLVLQGRIAHGGHPVLRWCADNVVVKVDESGNIRPDKMRATERIDGIVAAIMALDLALKHEPKKPGGLVIYDSATDTFTRNGVLIDAPKRGT